MPADVKQEGVLESSHRFIRNLDDESFHSVLEHTSGLSVVFFTSQGCASCRHWKELFRTFLMRYDDVHVFAVDAQASMALTQAYEVFHLPSLFLFIDGVYHCALQSEATLGSLRKAIDEAVLRPAEDEP